MKKRETNMQETRVFENQMSFKFFLSLFIFLTTLMSLLFTRMEMKRKSYEIYKLSSEFKIVDDEYQALYTDYSSKVSDQTVSSSAGRLFTAKTPEFAKIVSMGSRSLMVKH